MLGEAAVGLALLAHVGPAERRLDAVAGVVGKGQADGAGGRDRQQVRVAQAVRADAVLQRLRQARREGAAGQVQIGIEQRERAALQRQIDRGVVGAVAHAFGDAPRHRPRRLAVVAQVQHHQRIAQTGEAQADAPLVARFLVLLRQRPHRHVEHVVEHAHGGAHQLLETGLVERRVGLERALHEARQVDRAEAAAAVGRQRLFAAGIGRTDALAVGEVVVAVDGVEEQHAGLGVVVGRTHDLVPQFARRQLAIDPQAIAAPVGAGGLLGRARFGAVHQLDVAAVTHRLS